MKVWVPEWWAGVGGNKVCSSCFSLGGGDRVKLRFRWRQLVEEDEGASYRRSSAMVAEE